MPAPAGRQIVERYGDGGFLIAGERHKGSVIVTPETTYPLDVADLESLTLERFSPVFEHDPAIEVLLIGCGAEMRFIPKDLRAALKEKGIGCDPMDTGAACRTYNVLATEDRRAAAILIAID
ncbi:MAG: MTH938/NDUFAF3 family protein [Alphaproteobacteria bacterium]|nr:MTH938/NDUFAF3 family protein [Alphaproteobacteria bacterium]